jgi:hypothetical protein
MNSLQLLQEMQEARWGGVNHLSLYDTPVGIEWQSLLFERMPTNVASLKDFKESFLKIDDVALAKNILTALLHKDLAYGMELMPLDRASLFTDRFFSLFSSQALYFSNSTWNQNEYKPAEDFKFGFSSWWSLTELTFDSGIIICDNSKIGVVWFSDDD